MFPSESEAALTTPSEGEAVLATPGESESVFATLGRSEAVLVSPNLVDPAIASSSRIADMVPTLSSSVIARTCHENPRAGIPLRSKLKVPRPRLVGSDRGDEDIFDGLAELEEERRPTGDEDLTVRDGGVGLSFSLNDEDPGLPDGAADANASIASSSSFRSLPSDAEDGDEVDRPVAVKKKKTRPDPPGSTLCDEASLQLLREKCKISDDIRLVVPDDTQRADAPPPGFFTLYENFVEHCLLWFPVPGFLLRFLEANGISLAQINPRGLRHLIGIYVLSRECNAEISTEQLCCLLEFRSKGRAEELRYTVSPPPGRVLIEGFPSKDDHFEDRFFFVKISERTIEADCISLVRTSWEKRVRPASTISKGDAAAIHSALVSGDGDWVKTFTRQRIQRALSTRVFPGKVLGRGAPRVSAFQRAEKAKAASTSMTATPKTPAAPVHRSHTLGPTPDEIARRSEQSRKRRLMSEGRARCAPDGTSPKRQKVDSSPAFTAAPSSLVPGPSGKAFALARATVSELSAQLDQLACCYEEDSRSRELELGETRRTNTELVERNRALEDDIASVRKREDELSGKLSRAFSRRSKDKEEIALLKRKLSDAETKVEEAVAEAKDEMARGFASQTRQAARSLVGIGGTAKDNMLDLAEIDAGLDLIKRLRQPNGPTLDDAEVLLDERKIAIYDARDVFDELVSNVRRALEITEDDAVDEDEEAE